MIETRKAQQRFILVQVFQAPNKTFLFQKLATCLINVSGLKPLCKSDNSAYSANSDDIANTEDSANTDDSANSDDSAYFANTDDSANTDDNANSANNHS